MHNIHQFCLCAMYFLCNTCLGLNILHTLLENVQRLDADQSFYQTYFLELLQHVFSVATDTSHTAGGTTNQYHVIIILLCLCVVSRVLQTLCFVCRADNARDYPL